jgi:uncharacterized LabA/DUF88 family protein
MENWNVKNRIKYKTNSSTFRGCFLAQSSGVIYAFIDSQNLNLGIKNSIIGLNGLIYQGWRLDFKKFYLYLKTKYNVSKEFLFIGKVAGNEGLYNYLTTIGFQLVFKPTLQYINGNNSPQTKGNVDAELVLHTMIEYNNFDKAIIVSCDGDYFCLIEYLEKNNKLLHLMIPNKYQYSSLYRPYAKYMIFVSDLEKNLK